MASSHNCPLCGRDMIAVVSRRTSANAYSRKQDTPVWWCPDCHNQIKRTPTPEETEATDA